jgi:hypothetical protein
VNIYTSYNGAKLYRGKRRRMTIAEIVNVISFLV